MSGFFSPAAAKMSTTSSETIALETICRMAWSSSSSVLRSPGALLARTDRTAWKNADIIADAQRFLDAARHRAKAWESSVTAPKQSVLAVLLGQDMLLAAGSNESRSSALPVVQIDQSKPWKSPQADLVFLQHERDGLCLVDGRLARAAAFRIGRQRLLQFMGQAPGNPPPGRPACP